MSTPTQHEVAVLDDNIATAIKTLAKSLGQAVADGRRTCVHCIHFDMHSEQCGMAGQRPPARVIAFGCELFEADPIPF